ncbi:DUF4232 domain-containing protein [Saccharopolyspora gregorii]|uniref:DUF4232 domain-containing protein n=1 Tax=Saccharopolyspora gregorii TaxID=33914 RepID=UPI0021AC846E|nr:DUF4232 domain-containing protein [Saccharopolyspora gregorii]
MFANIRRIAAAAAVTGAVAGISVLSAGAATANPSDTACTAADVNVTVVKEQGGAAGHEAFRIDYAATNPDVNCKLQGGPRGLVFNENGAPIPGIDVVPENSAAEPVNLTASSPAHSYLIQAADAAPHAAVPTGVEFSLPSALEDDRVATDWPGGEQLKGVLQATPVAQG